MMNLIPLLLSAGLQGPADTEDRPATDWRPCPSDIQTEDKRAECAMVPMPLYHDQPDGETIDVAVMRILSPQPGARQLWFLDGGPGDAGRSALPRLAALLGDTPPVDFYTADHRGVGGTALLECPEQQRSGSKEGREVVDEEWIGCMEWIAANRPDLPALTAYESARDLGALIERFRDRDTPVFVMGISYGTFLAQQYLHLFPDQPDAVILDGLVPLDWSFAEFDANLDGAARKLLSRCAGDSLCATYLGPDPAETTTALLERMEGGHCQGFGLTPDLTRLVMGVLLMGGDPLRRFLPAIVHRLHRCAFRDQTAMIAMFLNLFESGGFGSEPASHSQVLQRHVSMSEMWPDSAPSPEALEQATERYVMTTNVSNSFATTYDRWPRAPSRVRRDYPSYRGPMLLLHGGLDPTMPVDRLAAMRKQYSRANQTWVVFPDGPHVVINDYDCALDVYREFLENPLTTPDTACVSHAPPVTFRPEDRTSQRVFGTADTWGERRAGWFKKVAVWAPWGLAAFAAVLGLR